MANSILAYGNLIEEAALSGGQWQADLPLTNLQDRRLGRVARSISQAEAHTTFDAEWPATRLFRVIALVSHNLSIDAQYRVRLSIESDFATTVADSGWRDVWPIVFPLGALPWGAPNWWSGKFAAADIASAKNTLTYILPRSMNARYIRVEISDELNTAGYVQIGRVFAADGWQPVRNIIYGASLSWESRTEVQEALSGAEYFNIRPAPRIAKVELAQMSQDEAMSAAFDMQRRMGVHDEVLFVWDPDDTAHALRRQFLARLRVLSAIENPGPDRWRTPFEIKELL